MNRTDIDTYCATLPGASASDPAAGDLDSWKVGGKMFACFGERIEGVAVKTLDIEAANLLIEMGRASRAPYFHKSWVLLPETGVDDDEVRERILTSYTIVRSGLTKKLQATLGPIPQNGD